MNKKVRKQIQRKVRESGDLDNAISGVMESLAMENVGASLYFGVEYHDVCEAVHEALLLSVTELYIAACDGVREEITQ